MAAQTIPPLKPPKSDVTTYQFDRGFPTKDAAQRARDDADYQRAVTAYRFWYPTVSCEGIFNGNRQLGVQDNEGMVMMSAGPRQVFFTANSDTPYAAAILDVTDGQLSNRVESDMHSGVVVHSLDKLSHPRAKSSTFFALCLATSVLAVAVSLHAQQATPTPSGGDKTVTSEQVNDANIQLMRQDIRAQRKKIVAENMPLTETEATKFWPLYDRYIGETTKVNDARYALIKEYSQNYSNMTDEQAADFIKRWVAFDGDNTQLRLKYIPEFEKVISPKKTALFFQIDRRLSMLIELQLASQVPLVKP